MRKSFGVSLGESAIVAQNFRASLKSPPDSFSISRRKNISFVDLRDPAQIDKVIADVIESYGRIDVIFANAGAGKAAPLDAITPEQINDQFALNFNGVFFTIQKAAPYLSHGSSIVIGRVRGRRACG